MKCFQTNVQLNIHDFFQIVVWEMEKIIVASKQLLKVGGNVNPGKTTRDFGLLTGKLVLSTVFLEMHSYGF